MDDLLKEQLAFGRASFEKKQYAQAELYLSQFVQQNQSFADVYNMLGLIFHQSQDFSKAIAAFESALRINPGYTEASLNLAVTYNDIGKYAAAREVYQAAIARQPALVGRLDPYVQGKIANMHADIGDVYASTGLLQEAMVQYQRALELGPSFVDIHIKLADAQRDLGLHGDALNTFEQLLALHPQSMRGRVHYGIALYSAGLQSEAVEVWESVLAEDPYDKSARMYLNLVGESQR